MEIDKFKWLLQRYFKKETKEKENALIDAWYKSFDSNESEITNHQEIKANAKRLLFQSIEKDKSTKIISIIPKFYKYVAAVLVISVVAAFFINQKLKSYEQKVDFITAYTKVKQLKRIELPDGSIAWLNAASRLRIPTRFTNKNREVYLEEGEAFFEVKKNPNKPFIVHTSDLDIQVLGTSFNVKAYKEAKNIKVAVTTGKVKVTDKNKTLSILTPNEELIFDKQSSVFVQNNNLKHQFNDWTTGKIYLHQVTFQELALVLKNNFNIQIIAGSKTVSKYQFTLSLSSTQSSSNILKIISAIHNSTYRKEGNAMILY